MASKTKTVRGTVRFTHEGEAKSARFTVKFTRLKKNKLEVKIEVRGGRSHGFNTDWPEHAALPPDQDARALVNTYAVYILPHGAKYNSVK